MPDSRVTSPLEIFRGIEDQDWFKEEDLKKEKEPEKEEISKSKKDVYARILKSTREDEGEIVEEELDSWFKRKDLDAEDKAISKKSQDDELSDKSASMVTAPLRPLESKQTAPLRPLESKQTAPLRPLESKQTAPLSLPEKIRDDDDIEKELLEDWDEDFGISLDWETGELEEPKEEIIEVFEWMEPEVPITAGKEQKVSEENDQLSLKSEKTEKKIKKSKKEESKGKLKDTEFPDLLKTLAECEKLLKLSPPQPKKVLIYCKKLLAAYPNNPLVYHIASEAYEKIGKKDKALKYKKKAGMDV